MPIRVEQDPNNDPQKIKEWFARREVEDLERGLVAARERVPQIEGEVEAVLEKLAALGHGQKAAAKRPRTTRKRETR